MKRKKLPPISDSRGRKLRVSIEILRQFNISIGEITIAAKNAFNIYYRSDTPENASMMYCVYAYLIIRVSAFYDELTQKFGRMDSLKKNRELISTIAHFKKLYNHFKVRSFRNYLAHNRKTVGPGNRRRYIRISGYDLAKVSILRSHTQYESFGIATERIMGAIDRLL
jgi:hypothetical protein